jgi:alpha-amylase
MAAIPHANVSGVLQKAPASAAVAASPMSHTVLALLQQTVPYSRCPYPLQSLVHNNSLCSQRRTSFAAAERYSQIEKLHRMHFQHKHGSPFLIIATATKGENADVLEGVGSQKGVGFSQHSSHMPPGKIMAAADSKHKLLERLRNTVDDTAASAVKEAGVAINSALTAAETAKEQAKNAEAALVEHIGLLHELSHAEKKVMSLEEGLLAAVHQLEVANAAIKSLHTELEAAKTLTKAGEARIVAAEASVHEIQVAADKAVDECENSSRHAFEVLMNATAVKEETARVAFNAQLEGLQQAVNTSGQKVEDERAQASRLEYQVLERSLAAAEAAAGVWKTRAMTAEDMLRQVKELGVETISSKSAVEQIMGGGRMQMLLEKDSRRHDLLENGPRRETPEWMQRRLDMGQQGLPPKKSLPSSADVEAMLPLELPSPGDVWSIAKARVKDDMYTAEAAEKQKIDLQRKVLEQALERKTIKKQAKDPEEAEGKLASGTGTGHEIVFQGFNWESWRRDWWVELAPKAADLSKCGITTIWLPPPTHSVAPQGYMPGDLYNLNSAYGTEDELKQCIAEMHNHNILVLGDVVLNHRCAQKQVMGLPF